MVDQNKKNSKYFCAVPFVHQKISTRVIEVCCSSNLLITNKMNASISEEWHGKKYKELRTKMLNDVPVPECSYCYKIEENSLESERLYYNSRYKDLELNVDTGNQYDHPVSYDLRNDNTCNLKCVMCHPSSSSQIEKELLENKDIIDHFPIFQPNFSKNALDEISESILKLDFVNLKLLGGEPSLIPGHFKLLNDLLDSGKASSTTVDITTNLTNLNNNFKQILKSFPNMHLQLSIDGLEKVVEYIRHPLNFDKWTENFEYIKKLNLESVYLHYSVQILNLHQLPEFVKFARKNYKDSNIGYSFNLVNFPTQFNLLQIPYVEREQIAKDLTIEYTEMTERERKFSNLSLIIDRCLEKTEIKNTSKLAKYLAQRDIVRKQNIKDFIPEIYDLIKHDYERILNRD